MNHRSTLLATSERISLKTPSSLRMSLASFSFRFNPLQISLRVLSICLAFLALSISWDLKVEST